MTSYLIKENDTLEDIAKKNNTSVEQIYKDNPNRELRAGSVIRLPDAETSPAPDAVDTSTTPAPSLGTNKGDIDLNQFSYDESTNTAYLEALAALNAAKDKVPNYKGTYDAQLNEIYNQIINRDKFKYDLNSDMLYQQYKDQYLNLGKMTMMDTVGQASALTGGYGNSWAVTAGNQAYQSYLQQLNDKVPELYGLALDRYNMEGQQLMDRYNITGDMADTEYGRYQDALDRYWQDINYLTGRSDAEYDRGFNNWYTGYQNKYQSHRDSVADSQWAAELQQRADQFAAELAYKENRDAIEDARYEQEYKDSLDRYLAELEYQKERDKISDERYNKEYEDALNQYYAELEYKKYRDSVEDARYNAKNDPAVEDEPPEDPTSGFDAGDWERYFANIREEDSPAAAQLELEEFIRDGKIPSQFVVHATSGARGGFKGH